VLLDEVILLCILGYFPFTSSIVAIIPLWLVAVVISMGHTAISSTYSPSPRAPSAIVKVTQYPSSASCGILQRELELEGILLSIVAAGPITCKDYFIGKCFWNIDMT
jgi:hypothetical protein